MPLLLSSHVSVPVAAHMDYRRQESWYVPAASKALPEGGLEFILHVGRFRRPSLAAAPWKELQNRH